MMKKGLKTAVLALWSTILLLQSIRSFAGIEPYVKYLNGPFTVGTSHFSNKDKAFLNPAYTWSNINNLSVQNAVTLQVVDSVLISTSFTYTVTLDVKYYTNPDTVHFLPKDTTVILSVNYVAGQGQTYQSIAQASISNGYQINVTVTAVNNHGVQPPNFSVRLGSSILINRKYLFQPASAILPVYNYGPDSTQFYSKWTSVTGAEQYDLEWTTINDGNKDFSLIDTRYKNPADTDNTAVTAALTRIFRNNSSRITLGDTSYVLSVLSTDTYLVLRVRQVQYSPGGIRQTGNWSYLQSGGHMAIFKVHWHQLHLNWQYSSAYAEDGKKKEVVSYFDGSLRGRQTVTLNNTDKVALAQENIYDVFGRPEASILPAAFVDSSGTSYLHFNHNFNLNSSSAAYSYADISGTTGTFCELNPGILNTISGASRYYSSSNDFYNHGSITGQKSYNSFIPVGGGYPLSVTQYTADNTGRIKIQGGVGPVFQPGKAPASSFSKTTKYYYGKPDQDELDQLFGNDVGFAEHYLKNMVVDPNGQISVSYVNASGKTVATALAGKSPKNVDSLSGSSAVQVQNLHILKPDQFTYNSSTMVLSASTTFLNSVINNGTIAFSIPQLIDHYPGTFSICSNCYYLMTVQVADDCGNIVASTSTPQQIGSSTSNCADTLLYTSSLPVNFQEIGAYYVTISFALNNSVITTYTNNFITQGTSSGYIPQQANYIKQHYLEGLKVAGCYQDCQTCTALLGTQASFVKQVQTELVSLELDSAAVYGTSFTGWADSLYTSLKDSCNAKVATCDYNPCAGVQNAMEADVSPGGQYALFDANGAPVDSRVNVISANWRSVFPILSPTNPLYQANLITLDNGTVTSPYDASFTLQLLVTYWKPDWAVNFLQYDPEYCKLKFCNTISPYENWDDQVQQINQAALVSSIPGASALTYKHTNASNWLLPADPFFKTGSPGYGFYSQMNNDLLHYSVTIMGIDSTKGANKGVMQLVDWDLYCNAVSGSTTDSVAAMNNWNTCVPYNSCRVPDREWRDYRDYYLSLKQKYYNILQSDSCSSGGCQVSQPVAYNLPGAAPSSADFTIRPDTGATVACAGSQSVLVVRNAAASPKRDTVVFYYPPVYDNASLVHHIIFNTNDTQHSFCVPDSIPISAILVANPLIPTPDTLTAVITDKETSKTAYTCTADPGMGKSTHTTHVVLVNKNGKPTKAGQQTTVVVQYLFTSSQGGGPGVYNLDFVAGIGDSTASAIISGVPTPNYVYVHYDEFNITPTTCSSVTETITCILSVTGGYLSASGFHTTCSGYTNVIPPPLCPPALVLKQSRFPTFTNSSPAGLFNTAPTALIDSTRNSIAQLAGNACSGNISTLMDSLKAGIATLTNPTAKTDTLQKKLLQICEAGSDSAHASGVCDLYGNIHHVPTTYLSFATAVKGVLGISSFTPALNPWMTPGPFPYNSQQQSTPKLISYSNQSICNMLTSLNAKATAAGKTLYNYLVATFKSAMTLSQTDLNNLSKSCNSCKFIIATDVSLPVFLDPGHKGFIKHGDFTTGVDSLEILFANSLDTTKAKGRNIMANYLNQRFGFTLNYSDYAKYRTAIATDTSVMLANQLPFQGVAIDSSDCLHTALQVAVSSGNAAYASYIDSLKQQFRTNYISTCSAAQANASVITKQQTYQYTLYYYDQADNLVRTVPPAGITLIDSSQYKIIDTTRVHDAARDCQVVFDALPSPPVVVNSTATKNTAFNAMATAIGAGTSRSLEFWLYNPPVAGAYPNNQLIEESTSGTYMLSLCISGGQVNLDIYTSTATATSVSYTLTNRFAATIPVTVSMQPWMHFVVQGPNLASGTLSCYLNGKALSPLTNPQSCNCSFSVTSTATAVTYPDNYATLKHMRIYSRLMTPTEILTNAGDQCMTPSNITGLAWYRFHVPTAGDSTTVAGNSTDESTLQHIYPNAVLPTNYTYNSTNQVSTQLSPDGGTNRYWYDLLSRLVISQNDKQNPLSNYSYTKYDTIGRITEVGQKNQTTINISTPHYLTNDTIGYFNAAGTNSQITATYYDAPVPTVGGHTNGIASVTQNNLRKRVSASTYADTQTGPVLNATYYTYDIDGNVKTIWQQVNGLYIPSTNAGLKRIDYEYDLISGKVNFVRYQDGQPDRFYYLYSYDADNRLTNAWSGIRAMVDTTIHSVLQPGYNKLDAKYYYYLHGPLARMELGDTIGRVQGVDYAYTLQGWMKGTNSSIVQSSKDMGRDSLRVAKDAYGYSLYYYGTGTDTLDYASISSVTPFSIQPAGLGYFNSLYNGNIAGQSTNIPKLTDPWHYYTYKYDQLNRIRQSYTYKVSAAAVATRVLDYSERFTYDGNGNIDSAARYMGANTKMDSTLYHYNTTGGRLINNRLNYITDNITTHNYPYGLDNQTVNNYTYDAIGNMTADVIDTISNINWTVYGKIQGLTNSKGSIAYSYDPAGQRATKTVSGITTYYIRDAQGNTLAIYDNTHSVVNWREQDLYGSSRLANWNVNSVITTNMQTGVNKFDSTGYKEYELTNHLGNVMVTITDKRLQHTTNGTTVDYFTPDISTAQEYYAFGGLMAGRTYTYLKPFRYGFNGKEDDNDVKGVGNQQDYGMRIYDPRTGKFYSVDPISKNYPELSTYQFGSNNPIFSTDFDGLEAVNINTNKVDNTLSNNNLKTYQLNKDISPWIDLLGFHPSANYMEAASRRGVWGLKSQPIELASSDKLNLDYYSISIRKLPNGFKSSDQFLSYVKKNLGNFTKNSGTSFGEFNSQELALFNSKAPESSIMRFVVEIGVSGKMDDLIHLDALSVITSKSAPNYWVFSPVTTLNDFEHPVAGNRQFGLVQNIGGSFTFFTRGADRPWNVIDATLSNQVFDGANKLWTTLMNNLSDFINAHGGESSVNTPVSKRISWKQDIEGKKKDKN